MGHSSESRFIDLLTKSWWVGGEAVNLPNPVCCCCWLELVEGSSGVLRIITVVEHLQRVGSGLGRRDSIATVAAIHWPAHAQRAPTP